MLLNLYVPSFDRSFFSVTRSDDMENIYTSSKVFLNFERALGLFPMSFEGPHRKGILKFKWFNAIPPCISLLIFISLLLSNYSFKIFFMNESNILDNAWDVLLKMEMLTCFSLFSIQIYRRKNVRNFLKMMHKADEEVNSMKR